MARRFDCRRVKLHHSYTIGELSALIGAHKHTIGRWIVAGLKTTDAKRPLLIHGADFRAFMKARAPVKQRCQPGELYCLGCRAPRRPALDMADYRPRTALRGSLSGICPDCGRMIYRATTLAKLDAIKGGLDIAFPKAEQRLRDGMSKRNAENERVKRRYLVYLKDAKGRDSASIDAAASAIERFEEYVKVATSGASISSRPALSRPT